MKFVRILSLCLVLLMLISTFAACGDTPEETTGDTKTPAASNDRDLVKDSVPLDLNYGGETVTFFVRSNNDLFKYELACEKLLNDPVYDAIHYRNIDVETRLGVAIKTIGQDGEFNSRVLWNETLSVSVLTNTGDFDGTAFYLSTGAPLAKDGIFYNLCNLEKEEGGYLEFSKPWWTQSLVDELGIFGTLFFVGGSLTISQVSNGVCIFFNRDMFNEKFPDERDAVLYQLVRDGKWTADVLSAYISQVWTDTNSNGTIDDGDVVGIRSAAVSGGNSGGIDAWIPAMGLKLTESNMFGEVEIALLNSRTVPAYEKMRSIFSNNPGALLSIEAPEETAFSNGNVLFYTESLNFGKQMRESEVNYGVLPLPKFDEEQDDYYTGFGNIASAVALCSNLSDERAEMLSAVLEVLSAESYKQVIPVYYGTILKGQYSREQADAEMYDVILDSFTFSFGFAYSSSSLGYMGAMFRNLEPDFDIQNHIDSNKDTWKAQLEELLEALEAVS